MRAHLDREDDDALIRFKKRIVLAMLVTQLSDALTLIFSYTLVSLW